MISMKGTFFPLCDLIFSEIFSVIVACSYVLVFGLERPIHMSNLQ